MARRGSLIEHMAVVAKAVEAAPLEPVQPVPAVARVRTSAEPPSKDTITTAIHIPKDVHDLLRRVAVERAVRDGGRPSVSAVLAELVRRHWDELTAEAAR